MSISDFDEAVIEMTEERTCVVCGDSYTNVEAYGRNECRRHTGLLQAREAIVYDGVTGTYTCCGVAPDSLHSHFRGMGAAAGCIQADHTDRQGLPADITMIVARARIFFGERLDERNVSVDGDIVTIHRVLGEQAIRHRDRR